MENPGTQQPGQTVTPTQPASAGAPQPSQATPPQPPAPAPAPVPVPATPKSPAAPAPTPPTTPAPAPAPQAPAPPTAPAPQASAPEPSVPGSDSDNPGSRSITWTASEFIAHEKSFGWYVGLAAVAAVAAVAVFFLDKDFISPGVIIFAAIVLGVYAGHQPRQLEYQVDTEGLSIGAKRIGYHQFRSFSVVPEGAFSSIVFMPLKRFAVPTTIYYAPEDEQRIVTLLADYLPIEKPKQDAIDRLMRGIRF